MSAHAQSIALETFDQRAGLKSIAPMSLLQDRSGLLWIGTMNGVYRYDGYRFDPAIIRDSGDTAMITGLAEDGLGRVWFSSSDSLGYFEGLVGIEVRPPVGGFSFDLANRLSPDPQSADRIYFVSHHILYQAESEPGHSPRLLPAISPRQVKDHPELAQISGVLATSSGQLWLGCGTAICALQGQVMRKYDSGAGLPPESWSDFFLDSRGALWARSDRHIFLLPAHADRFHDIGDQLSKSLLSVRQPQIVEDHQGRILINLASGLARFDAGAWRVFREGMDLPTHTIRTLLVDRQGSIWLALDGGGVARWVGYHQFENYTVIPGLSGTHTIWSFLRDGSGNLWIATENGLRLMHKAGTKIELPTGGNGSPLQRSQSLALMPNGHLWSGSDNGKVIDFNPASGASRIAAQFDGGVFQVFPASQTRLWACTMSGLFLLEQQPAPQALQTSLIRGRVYEGLRDPSGDSWFIAASGLYRLSHGTWTHIRLPDRYRPAFSAQIARASDGTFWISGSPPALLHIRVEGDMAHELQSFDSPPLGSKSVVLIAHDRRGWLWVGGDEGLDVYNGARWRHLDAEDGLVSNDVDSSAFLDDQDGSIWIGTSGGISHILHPESIFSQEELNLHLGTVRIGDRVLTPGVATKVSWGHQPLTANLSTLDFARAARTTFRYRIEGLNEDWQDSPKHELRYPPLEPGSYRLAVRAVDAPDQLLSPPIFVDFEITPPWWRSAPMKSAEAVFLILGMFAIWRWSVRRHLARERQLEDLVRQRTQELETEKSELLKTRAALQIQATHDSLTGLLNHGAALRALASAMERCTREKSTLGVVLADLDHFKQVNDVYGHLTGDLVLQEYAKRIQAAIRPYDEVGRYGGEEILIILPGLEYANARQRLQELHRAVCSEPFEANDGQIVVTCSFGFTWFHPEGDTGESVIDRADAALYVAKENGRNRIAYAEEPPA